MRWLALASVFVSASAAAKPVWRPMFESPDRVAATAAAELASEIRSRDAGAITRRLAVPFTAGPLWFPDAACTKRFGNGGLVTDKDAPVLARCLAKLDLEMSTRKSSLRDGAVLTAKPGFEIEIAFHTPAGQLRWLSSPAHAAREAARPMLTAQAFEALRTRGSTQLDAAVAGELAGEVGTRGSASAWLRVCVDAAGKLAGTTVVSATSTKVGEVFTRATADWQFQPFRVRGAATAACALSLLTYPATEAPAVEVLPGTDSAPVATSNVELDEFADGTFDLWGAQPPPPPPALGPASISVRTLESLRRRGSSVITPDAQAKQELGARKTITVAKVCIDVVGAVSNVVVIRSSGAKAWEAQLDREARRWSFRPYSVGGAPQPACAVMTFSP